MQKSVALHTLGCKLNYSETTSIGRLLEQDGFIKKNFNDVADVYIINTCSVTENADKECRQLVRRIKRKSPASTVVITGCYAQLKPQEISNIPGVNLVLGAAEKFNIVSHLNAWQPNDPCKICTCDIEDVNVFTPTYSVSERTRVFLKVQDGCDYSCSFCTIPQARGKSRSNAIDQVLLDVKNIAQQGVKEIVLTGINLGDFGKGIYGGKQKEETFFELMQALENQDNVERFRISSIEPNLLTEEMIHFVSKSKKFMPHFHIPLQSGNNRILGLMKRRYQRELYADRVSMIKSLMPHCCIGVDVIVGFPGESDEDFKSSATFIEEMDISYMHVFTYSERDNTLAATMPEVVPVSIRNERNAVLRNLSYQKMLAFTNLHAGQTRPVLFEAANKNGTMEGYTDNYIKVSAMFNKEWENKIIDWKLP
jgi:threonylcarbamoyladenosine tRNA methylthiotransferase MtaB